MTLKSRVLILTATLVALTFFLATGRWTKKRLKTANLNFPVAITPCRNTFKKI
jgi:hypothetical protein